MADQERVLVTGASGFIGRALVKRLVDDGVCVAGLSRHAEPGASYKTYNVDLNDADGVIAAVKDFAPTLCYHLASHPDGAENHDQSIAVLQTNVMGTLNLLEGLRLSGGARLVYGCSVKVYGNGPVPYHCNQAPTPNSSYAVSKAAGREMIELYRRLYGLASVSIRPTLVYGPGQGRNLFSFVAEQLANGVTEITLMGGSQTRAPVYIDDAVDAFVRAGEALTKGTDVHGLTIPISGTQELPVWAFVELMAKAAGQTLVPKLEESETRPTEIFRSLADNTLALALLGWQPKTDLLVGIARTLEAAGVDVKNELGQPLEYFDVPTKLT